MRRSGLSLGGIVLLALALGACGDGADLVAGGSDEDGPTSPAPSTVVVPEDEPAPPVSSLPDGRVEDAAVALERVATLDAPVALAVRPGGSDLFVAERGGRIVVVDPSTGDVSAPVVDISSDVSTDGERGLLGVTFTADGSELVLSWTDGDGASVIEARPVGADGAIGEPRRLLWVEQPAANHNGGHVAVGPDGLVYIGLGDGGGGGDPWATGQDPSTLLGSILRIDPAGDPYAVPADNPFVDGGGAPEVWLYGVRNPWRFSFDRATGDLWVADVGQGEVEEVDLLPAAEGGGRGANLGWSEMEGSRPFEDGVEPSDHVPPVFEYTHDEGCSITGGIVYRGTAIPALVGSYVFTDYCDAELRAVQVREDEVADRRLGVTPEDEGVVSFGEGADGELYVLSINGGLWRLVPA
jgi:glucose/arabinose dehydrogenase